ncbi:cell division protein FtsQ/DivIB [Alkalicoccus urumqiensis]|uniref:Cell division protein DivIB n=1 Tax=Alkalicoccus urumqiensis TaxID=1548213 RepID=A0A2P6MGC2_ALKUR|nr:FtsQ-type POTRA domain-containing protein [Alkalicoccus urumqiensis]PRO65313.1 cell division protein FtsQ [Alkalicoccus urumqiensis]
MADREQTVVDLENKLPELQKRRRKRAKRRLYLYLSLLLFTVLAVIYSQSSWSHVGHVEVSGSSSLADDEIVSLGGITEEVSMWNLDREEREARIQEHAAVSGASIERNWPRTLKIHITEEELAGFIEEDGALLPLLASGQLFPDLQAGSGEAPVLLNMEETRHREMAAEQLSILPGAVFNRISEMELIPEENDPYRVRVLMNDGFIVHSTLQNFAERMTSYPSVVQQLDPDVDGILHMRVNPYFESFESEDEEEEEVIEDNEDNSGAEELEGT